MSISEHLVVKGAIDHASYIVVEGDCESSVRLARDLIGVRLLWNDELPSSSSLFIIPKQLLLLMKLHVLIDLAVCMEGSQT